ncbi:mannitol dehydrogenase family protein [Galbitalea soli]|uniref:Mannitol dehydrogenase family protein n=1 Tax=Galbitalea soli TaxID=1268042 RepID=A0A7C9TMP5_9MICO|nr:mannitol dehydrogenase family protein [Galbitalea soli]NEM89735.1 mannitol dehydrogenase family protein [Galbitalea soli]NYJ30435.1 mannitol 2-dehydrogenase [Galbitalea soli]
MSITLPTLSDASVDRLDVRVARPSYDRAAVGVGIVQLGVGGFHRAQQAVAIDTLMNLGQAMDWGICGIGVHPSERRVVETLARQDGLYTLILRNRDGSVDHRIIGSMVGCLYAPDDPRAVVARLLDPAVRIVSLAAARGGYGFAIRLVVEGLRRRRERGMLPFTVLSCDDPPGNGERARGAVTETARGLDERLADWIDREVRFPRAVVEPAATPTTAFDVTSVARATGLSDGWPVITEPGDRWAVEDDFGAGRPHLEISGVSVVDDIEPYELLTIRLQRGGLTAAAYLGALAGYRYLHEVGRHPTLARLLVAFLADEVGPTLRGIAVAELAEAERRFRHRLAEPRYRGRLPAVEASPHPVDWLLPIVRTRLDAGCSAELSAAIVAAWRHRAGAADRARWALAIDAAALPELDDFLASLAAAEHTLATRGIAALAAERTAHRAPLTPLTERSPWSH